MIAQQSLGRLSLLFLAMGIYLLMAIFFPPNFTSGIILAVALLAIGFPKFTAALFVWCGMIASMVFILAWILL